MKILRTEEKVLRCVTSHRHTKTLKATSLSHLSHSSHRLKNCLKALVLNLFMELRIDIAVVNFEATRFHDYKSSQSRCRINN